ncbi:MAG: ROK family protein [Bacillota bacterium]
MPERTHLFSDLRGESRQIYNLIQKKGPLAKNDLVVLSGLKPGTLNNVMAPLEKRKLIISSETGESTGGRKPSLFSVNPKAFYLAGVDISRTYTQVVVVDPSFKIVFQRQFPMDESFTPQKTAEIAAIAIKSFFTKPPGKSGGLLGIGLGVVGPLDREKGLILNPVHFPAPGWRRVAIGELFRMHLSCPVYLDNGANAAVLAEYLYGAGKGFQNIVYFNCGMGIRTGIISAGHIVRSMNNAEDAFGHMIIDVDGELCGCGNYGCIECYASIPSVVRRFLSEMKKGVHTSVTTPLGELNYEDICRAAEGQDELACGILKSAAAILGSGIANCINLLNPGLLILSGPLIRSSALFYDVARDTALKKCLFKEEKVSFAKGGCYQEQAIATGAAAMVLEEMLM